MSTSVHTSHAPTALRRRSAVPAAVAAAVAAVGFAVEGVIALTHHTGDRHWDLTSQILNGAYTVACLALIVALPAFATRTTAAGRWGRIGTVTAQVGFATMAVESVASGIHDGNTLGGVFFGGLLLTLAGLAILTVAGLRQGALRWAAPLPLLGMLVGIAGGEHGGSIVLGAVWAVLAVALATGKS
jgi:hypothetical protein